MINQTEKPIFHQKCSVTSPDELKIEEINAKKKEISFFKYQIFSISQLFLLPDFLSTEYFQDQI